ncbi:hypothetical protein PHLGIDRAFT_119581 [Phlebiopsis gigantea 11061_1 CR5-6]|uniref:Uncharacterized protein n=1 Tax=Phlebiopsis gigantea (strain 11061_1 CR5-6) TaxID=745531 RepID=A0A0C3S5L2_PHLG1|nr:hypothetical protein PHLGIDRAFT_119581 [Phlebiopsis gigantea 11061_1 CR5-6]
MTRQLPGYEVILITLFVYSVVYGVYLVTFGCSMYLSFSRRSGTTYGRTHWIFLAASALLFALLALKTACDVHFVLQTFVFYDGPGGAAAGYANAVKGSVSLIEAAIGLVLVFIGESLLVYRCLVVYLYQWTVIALPSALLLLALASDTTTFVLTIKSFNFTTSPNQIYTILDNLTLAADLATSVVTTGLISWRLWRINREASRLIPLRNRQASTMSKLLRIFIESGLLYTVFIIMSFAAELASLTMSEAIQGVMYIVIGISFELISIRIHLAREEIADPRIRTHPPTSLIVDIHPECEETSGSASNSTPDPDVLYRLRAV